jgi:putative membrane protein
VAARPDRPLLWVFPTVFVAVWAWAAWEPTYRFDWFLENLLVFLSVPVLIWVDRKRPFSTWSVMLLTLFLCLHVIGSHWTYSNVPGPWAPAGGRNSFDRLVHLTWGLLLAPVGVEALASWKGVSRGTGWALTLMAVLATSAVYEIVEMATALIVAPDLGDAFLGTQGDSFDAVKDMAMAWVGSLLAAGVALVAWLGSTLRSPARGASP